MTQLVTVELAGRTLGIDVADVHDVIRLGAVSRVPLAPKWVAGMMNLRGRIVTAIDLRARLGIAPAAAATQRMCIVVQHGGEPYALIVDGIGDVIDVDPAVREANPKVMDAAWKAVSRGVLRLETLIIMLDIAAVMSAPRRAAA